MELEPRISVPAHATGAVEFVDLTAIVEDATFRLREEGDVSALAASMGRLGQLVPLELRPLPQGPGEPERYQVVAGFRRVAALRLLRRERALARVHAELSDEDAWGLALSLALLTEPLDRAGLEALREGLAQSGMAPWADELVDEALVRAPVDPEVRERFLEFLTSSGPAAEEGAPELDALDDPDAASEGEAGLQEDETVEVTPEELAGDLATKLYEVNQDLALAYESWADLPPEGQGAILEQARWIADLLRRLEADGEEDR
jgi:ParB-like chromosome segregation protein Spo0J